MMNDDIWEIVDLTDGRVLEKAFQEEAAKEAVVDWSQFFTFEHEIIHRKAPRPSWMSHPQPPI